MRVIKSDGMYKIARISGPKHNYLGLILTASAPMEVEVRSRIAPEKESCDIEEPRLLVAVSEGVQEGNRDTGQSLFVKCLEYVPTDTPDYNVYKELARTIIQSASQERGEETGKNKKREGKAERSQESTVVR